MILWSDLLTTRVVICPLTHLLLVLQTDALADRLLQKYVLLGAGVGSALGHGGGRLVLHSLVGRVLLLGDLHHCISLGLEAAIEIVSTRRIKSLEGQRADIAALLLLAE